MTISEQPLISVIIPTFNRAGYVVEAIESILAQTYRPIEIIVVDDGSTDHTSEAVGRYHGCVRYFWQPNQGSSVARNTGVSLSEGDLLAFLDSDDLWLPDKLTLQMNALKANPDAEAVTARMRQFYSPELDRDKISHLWCPENVLLGCLPTAYLIWRSAFLRVGFYDPLLRNREVMGWAIHAREVGLRTVDIEDCVFLRRVHTGNKGIVRQDNFRLLATILKAALDRKRQNAELEGNRLL